MSVLPNEDQQQYLRVLLVENEANTISVLSLFLSEIKECKYTVCESGKHALNQIPAEQPHIVLFAHGLDGEESLQVFAELHRSFPSVYLLVAIPDGEQSLATDYVNAGAVECIFKDKSYILKLVYAVKNAMIRVADRQKLVLPPMPRAEQLSMDENLPDVVFVLDADGKFLHANRVVTDVLGYEPNALVQRPLMELMDPRNTSSFQNYLNSTDVGKHFQEQVSIRKKNGLSEVFDLNCTEIEDFLIYGVARPRKMPKQAQRATTRMKEELPPISDDSLPPLIGPYRVVTLLGAGSTGRVYKGYDESLDRYVAIKVISKVLHGDSEHLERFHREAKILASITHPHIALVYYFGNLQGLPYFCMEYLPGGSLENLLQKEEKLPAETAISYTMQVAVGLHEAYKKGVVHLDIKPSNIMIAENERVKIVDFGFARKTEKERAESGDASATKSEPVAIPADYRVDIFSLGVTLHRMLYGTIPHSAIVENLELLDERKLGPDITKSLCHLVERMLSREPGKQFKDYPELIEELEKARRLFVHESAPVEAPVTKDSSILMRGLIFDSPFPEVLGQISTRRLTGKLTVSWIDICKNIYFRDGIIVAVLSNQEGERFIEVLMKMNQLSGKKLKKVESEGYDLLKSYSWAFKGISSDVKDKVAQEMKQLAFRTLQGLFSLVTGEYIFDQSKFRGELTLQIPADELVVTGVKSWLDPTLIRRRLHEKQFRIKKHEDSRKLIAQTKIPSSDTFLMFRFEDSIHFQELFPSSGITEQECLKLIYLYKCFGLIEVIPEQYAAPAKARPAPEVVKPPTASPPAPQAVTPPKQEGPPVREAQRPRSALEEIESKQISENNKRAAHNKTEQDYFSYYQHCAEDSFANKNYWAAVEYCKKALDYKKDPAVFSLMGNAFATHPKFRSEAMEAFKKALQMDGKNPSILRDIADLYYDSGSLKLAKARYEDVLSIEPKDQHSKKRIVEISKKV